MRRFQGEPLPAKAKIAVISNDAIGNFVAATPLLQLLRTNFPESFLGYFAGTRVAEFCDASALFDHWHPVHGVAPSQLIHELESQAGTYHLVINMEQSALAKFVASALVAKDGFVCGPCLDAEGRKDLPYASDARGDLWRDKDWVSPDVCRKYPFLKSGFICEIFARLAYLSGDVPGYCVPTQPLNAPVPDVLIAPSASLPEKLWPAQKWSTALTVLADLGLSCGILGAAPATQAQYWKGQNLESDLIEAGLAHDLRGKLTLPQVATAVDSCRAVLTLDNGIMHLATAGNKPVVALFRHGIHRLWAPPAANLIAIVSEPEGTVGDIAVQPVIDALACALGITCPK